MLRHHAYTQPLADLDLPEVRLHRCRGIRAIPSSPSTPRNKWSSTPVKARGQKGLHGYPLRCRRDPDVEHEGPPGAVGQQLRPLARVLHDGVEEAEVAGALVAEQQRRGLRVAQLRGRVPWQRTGVREPSAPRRRSPRHNPLEAVAAETLVARDANEAKLLHGYVDPVAVDDRELGRSQLIEKRPDDRPCDGVSARPYTSIDSPASGTSLRARRHAPRLSRTREGSDLLRQRACGVLRGSAWITRRASCPRRRCAYAAQTEPPTLRVGHRRAGAPSTARCHLVAVIGHVLELLPWVNVCAFRSRWRPDWALSGRVRCRSRWGANSRPHAFTGCAQPP